MEKDAEDIPTGGDTVTHMYYMRKDIKEIKNTLSAITSNYVPNSIYINNKSEIDKDMTTMKKEIMDVQQAHISFKGRMWGVVATLSILWAIVTFLLKLN